MMRTKKIITNLCLFTVLSTFMWPFFVQAQTETVKVSDFRCIREKDQVAVYMNFILDEMRTRKNDMLVLTPTLKANGGSERISLSPVIIAGSTRFKILARKHALGKRDKIESNLQSVIKRKNKTAQTVNCSETIPFAEWMKDASLLIDKQIIGCAGCQENISEYLIADRIIKEPYVPLYKLTYIIPEAEPVKNRSEHHTASFAFEVNRSELLQSYRDNASELSRVEKTIKDVQDNENLNITEFTIKGYASPEGRFSHNMGLSQNRANSFADYLVAKYAISRERFKVEGLGEDWQKLRELINASDLFDKEKVLHIIDHVLNPDARDIELKKLSRGNIYKTLLKTYYPLLRRTDYTITYTVKAFDVEEAKRIIKTDPKLLSLNEMYLVAETYSPESKEFKEVFDIAARLYPESEFAIVNSAVADIEGGNTETAIQRMSKVADNPNAWNNLGVAYARQGEIDKAKTYFSKAIEAGNNDARKNMHELQKYIDNLSE